MQWLFGIQYVIHNGLSRPLSYGRSTRSDRYQTLPLALTDFVPKQEWSLREEDRTLWYQNLLPCKQPPLLRCSSTDIGVFGIQDYDGEPRDARGGREYFKKRFARLAQKANQKEREIYIQYVWSPTHICWSVSVKLPFTDVAVPVSSTTTATDTAMLRVVMAAVEGTSLDMCYV